MAGTPDQIISDIINLFYGGISPDRGIQRTELFGVTQHFDIFSSPNKITPYICMVADQVKAYNIVQFLYANNKQWGLGQFDATHAYATVYKKASDPISDVWTAATNGADSSGAFFGQCFIAFHNYAYGGAASSRIWAADLTETNAFTSTAYSGASGPICQGIVTTDDLLLIPCINGIARKNGAGTGPTDGWSTFAIVPASHVAVDICEIGDLVAIFAKPASGLSGVNSKIFIWDKYSPDPSQVIDLGAGDVMIGDEIEGELVAVLQASSGTTFSLNPKLIVRTWSGGSKAQVVIEIPMDQGISNLTINGNHTKVKDGNKIIFGVSMKLDGVTYCQLGTLGRKQPAYPLAFTLDRLVNNDTAITGINGVGKTGDFYWIAYNSDGSVNRTYNGQVFTNATAVYISQKKNGEDRIKDAGRRVKSLKSAGIITEPLTSGQSVSLYYRTDGNSSWTLIRTYTYGDDAAAVPAIVPANTGFEAGVDATGADFQNYKEVQFKATATGGAQIMGIPFTWQLAGTEVSP